MKINEEQFRLAWNAWASEDRLGHTFKDSLRAAIETIEPEPASLRITSEQWKEARFAGFFAYFRESRDFWASIYAAFEAIGIVVDDEAAASTGDISDPQSGEMHEVAAIEARLCALERAQASDDKRIQALEGRMAKEADRHYPWTKAAPLTEARVLEVIEARLAAYRDGIDRVARAIDADRVREIVWEELTAPDDGEPEMVT